VIVDKKIIFEADGCFSLKQNIKKFLKWVVAETLTELLFTFMFCVFYSVNITAFST
jgi:hypothetical protein